MEAVNRRAEPSGLIRIAAPVLFGSTYVVPAIADFIARYPRIEADLKVSDRPIDVVGDGFDLAVRIRELPDSSLKARRLGELRTVVYGAPGFFARHGRPDHPDDLVRHQCVLRSTSESETVTWRFQIDGQVRMVRVGGCFRADNTTAVQAAVCHGLGIGYGPFWQIRDLVDRGALEIVLAQVRHADLAAVELDGIKDPLSGHPLAGDTAPLVDRAKDRAVMIPAAVVQASMAA